jgi:hypothetical protein
MLGIDGTGVGNVVLSYLELEMSNEHTRRPYTSFWVYSEPFCDLSYSLGPEGTFRVCITVRRDTSVGGVSIPIYATLPSAPPISFGSCAMTEIVCESCVFPQRNSPKTSLMLIV